MIVHIVGFDFILHYKFTYEIYRLKEKTVAAFIMPKEKIVMPGMKNLFAGTPAGDNRTALQPIGGAPSGAGGAGSQQKPAEPRGIPGAQAGRPEGLGLSPQSQAEARGVLKETRNLSSGFVLAVPPNSKLDLSKEIGNLEDSYLPHDKYRARTDINFSKYLYPGGAASSVTGVGGRPGRPGKTGAKAYIGGPAPANIQKVDLSRWANAVMNRIQKNWSISTAGDFTWKGEVGITVLVGKTGNLTLIEVIAPSKNDALDQAAMRALEMSAPFPALPAEFPDSSLEVYFIFQYGN